MFARKVILILVFIILLSSFSVADKRTITVLSDYFEGGLSKWEVTKGNPKMGDQGVYLPGGSMYAKSNQMHGTWEFVIFTDYKGNTWEENYVGFIVETMNDTKISSGYVLGYNEKGLSLLRIDENNEKITLFTKHLLNLQTEKQIKITRDRNGLFKVYINGELFKEVIDNSYKKSNYFVFSPLKDNVGYIGAINVHQTVTGTCKDKILNQLEEGIDCGGPCESCIKEKYDVCFIENIGCKLIEEQKIDEKKMYDILGNKYELIIKKKHN